MNKYHGFHWMFSGSVSEILIFVENMQQFVCEIQFHDFFLPGPGFSNFFCGQMWVSLE